MKWFLFLLTHALVCQKEANFTEVKWRRPSAASVLCQVNWNCVLTLVLLEKWTTAARLGTWRTRVNGETWLAVHMSDAAFCDNVVFQWNVWHYKDEGVGWRYWNLARSISDIYLSRGERETIVDDDFCDISGGELRRNIKVPRWDGSVQPHGQIPFCSEKMTVIPSRLTLELDSG